MQILIHPGGTLVCVYQELIDLTSLGALNIRRVSHVEPDSQGNWHADLSPLAGPMLGPYSRRSEALAAEAAWLESHGLPQL